VYSKLTTIPEMAKCLPYKSPGQSHHGMWCTFILTLFILF
jgi:hypothetical protein